MKGKIVVFMIAAMFCGLCCADGQKTVQKKQPVSEDRDFHKRFDDPILNVVVYNGWTHYHEGRFDNALNDFERLLATGNIHYDVYFGAGLSGFQMRDYNKAVNYFSRCLKSNPDHFESLFYRAEANRLKGDAKSAKSDYAALASFQFFNRYYCGSQPEDYAGQSLLDIRRSEALKKCGLPE